MARTFVLRQFHLNDDLPPVVAVDPGSKATGIVVRISDRHVYDTLVMNDDPGQKLRGWTYRQPGIPPERGYVLAVIRALAAAIEATDAEARAWWRARGHDIPVGAICHIVAVEKMNASRDPRTVEWFESPTAETMACTIPGVGIVNAMIGKYLEDIVFVKPDHADDRWEVRFGGTGDPRDAFPASIIEPAAPAAVRRGVNWQDGLLNSADLRASRVKDLAAAWSVATDAAVEYVRCADEWNHLGLVPPHRGAHIYREALREMQRSLRTPVWPRLNPIEDLHPRAIWHNVTDAAADGREDEMDDTSLADHYAYNASRRAEVEAVRAEHEALLRAAYETATDSRETHWAA